MDRGFGPQFQKSVDSLMNRVANQVFFIYLSLSNHSIVSWKISGGVLPYTYIRPIRKQSAAKSDPQTMRTNPMTQIKFSQINNLQVESNRLVDIDRSPSMRVDTILKADDEQTFIAGDLEGQTFLAGDIADANPDFRTNLIEEDPTEEQRENEMSD